MKYYFISIFTVLLLFLLPSCGQKEQEDVKIKQKQKQAEKEEWLPEIAPYLDSKPSAIDGQGSAVIQPKGPFPVGSLVDFQITFTIGKAGIAPGGFVLLQISPWWGWSQPQNVSPEAEGFITVTPSFADPSLQVRILSMHRALVFSPKKPIKPGETITFKYTRALVDKFAEREELFMIFVDADGDGHSACITNPPIIQTTAREPVYLNTTAPPQARPGETIKISAAPLDALGNWSQFPSGSFTLSVTHNDQVTEEKNIKAKGNEKTLIFDYTLPGEGIYFFHVKGPGELQGKSNVTLSQEGIPQLKLYFGDIHGHSRLSDGTGTPGDYYRYAREVSGLDIAALTDHADYGLIPIKGKTWERIKNAANNMYAPGHFVTFVAFEWTNWTSGHRNVYYRDQDGPIFSTIDKNSDTPEKLWKQISPYEVMTIGHHVGGGPVPIDWSIPPGPKEWLVEICSVHGSSEYYGCEAGIYHPQQGHFVRDALSLGYKLGIMASGDTHDGHPGLGNINAPVTGIMGVYAPELTREAVWEALKKRQVYGTSGPKIILNFRVGDSPMGSEIKWPKAKGPIPIVLRAVCCEDIEKIEIIRSGVPIFLETGEKINGVFALLLIEDPEPQEGTSWYYARVIQKDGNMAWSSPVWVSVASGGQGGSFRENRPPGRRETSAKAFH
jgi:hypothetical protein